MGVLRVAGVVLWRAGALLALCWIGYELHQVRREMPSGELPYDTVQQIRFISLTIEKMRDDMRDIEKNTRRIP